MTVIAMSRTEIDRMNVLQDLAANRNFRTSTAERSQHCNLPIGKTT
jgi:hypothetical protein